MTEESDLVRGMRLTRDVVHAFADGDEQAVLRHINAHPGAGERGYAAASLGGLLRDVVLRVTSGDQARAAQVLRGLVSDDADEVENAVRLIIHKAMRGGRHAG